MRLLTVLYLLAIGILALLAQMILPVIFPILNIIGFGSSLVPLVVIYASLELGDGYALSLAGVLGILVDLNCSPSHHLGISTMVLFSLSALIVTQAARPESHTWPFRLIFVLVGTFIYILLTYVIDLAETARWYWPLAVWSKITFGSLLNLFLCPFFFFLVGLPLRLCGWKPDYQNQERSSYAR